MITIAQFKKIFGEVKDAEVIVKALSAVAARYKINTKDRICAFLAQLGHESGNFRTIVENLNYSQQGLRTVFSKYFPTDAIAAEYARKPEKIANRVYANRMGNGPESSGDGWKYRGRGAIQLTGKNNYTAFAKSIEKSLDETVAYLGTWNGAIESACWFWTTNNLNTIADKKDMTTLTKRINGGTIGLAHRMELYNKCQMTL